MSPIILPAEPSGYTFLSLQDQALHDDFDAGKYREPAKRFLNEAQARIFRQVHLAEGDGEASVNLTPGVGVYELPTDAIRVDSLRDPSTARTLYPASVPQFDAHVATDGTPVMFAQIGRQIHVHPTPQQAMELRVRFRLVPGFMVEDDDYPQVPPDYQHLLVTYARSRLFRLEDDADMAAFYWAEWLRDLAEMRGDVQRRGTRVRQVPGMWAFGFSRPVFGRP